MPHSLHRATLFLNKVFHKKNRETGNDLLSREANRSTIGAEGLNFRVRHGTGWTPFAIVTCFSVSIKIGSSSLSLSSRPSGLHPPAELNSTKLNQVKASED